MSRTPPFRALGIDHVDVKGGVDSRYGAEGEGLSLYIADPEGNALDLKGPAAKKKKMPDRTVASAASPSSAASPVLFAEQPAHPAVV